MPYRFLKLGNSLNSSVQICVCDLRFFFSLITKPYLTKSQNFQSYGRLNLSKVSNKQQVDHEKDQFSIFIKCSDYGDFPVLTQNISHVSVYLIRATVSWDWKSHFPLSRWRNRFWGNTVTYPNLSQVVM